ncbi:ATP cone domain-containing protein [Planctomycetota bacterium]
MIHHEGERAVAEVRKRDGRVVPFDKDRIGEAIFRAASSAGNEDRHMANELAEVVTLFVIKTYGGETPGIDKIQDAVEKVLTETGHVNTADAFRKFRLERDEKRRSLEVRREPEQAVFDVPLVDAASRESIGDWERSKIASALEKEAMMHSEVAREIARAVEQKVFSSGMRRVSTSLIRALVDNELFERGMSIYQQRQRMLGMPTYDLEKMLIANPGNSGKEVAETVMRQFTLHTVLAPDVSRAHMEGRIHVYNVEDAACRSGVDEEVDCASVNEESIQGHFERMANGVSVRFRIRDAGEDVLRLPVVTVNLIAAAVDAPVGRSDLCLAVERAVAAGARAQGQRSAFARKVDGNGVAVVGPIGFAGLNECASLREEDAAKLVPWIRKCVGAQYERGVRLVLTTESHGAERFRSSGERALPSEGLGLPGTPLQRLFAVHEFSEMFDEGVLVLHASELPDPKGLLELITEAQRLGTIDSIYVA